MDKKIIALIKKGESLNKIKNKTGVSKSSLYHHYKKIHGKKYKGVKINLKDRDSLGEFIGIFAGDGNFFFDKIKYHYRIRVFTGLYEKQYNDYIQNFFTRFFSKKPMNYENVKSNVYTTNYYSKEIYLLIKKYLYWDGNKTKTVGLRNINKNDKEFLIGFLRGLFDTDGGINKAKNKTAFGTASKKLAYQIKEILEIFNLKPGFYKYKNKDFWYIDLYGKRTDKFMSLIKPHNKNKILARY